MEKIVIFGVSQLASLAHFYFENDSPHQVVAFTVDNDYINEKEFRGLPVVAFEDIEKQFPPSEYKMFLPISFKQMSYFFNKITYFCTKNTKNEFSRQGSRRYN